MCQYPKCANIIDTLTATINFDPRVVMTRILTTL